MGMASNDDHLGLLEFFIRADQFEEFAAGDAGQAEVQQDQIGAAVGEPFEGGMAVKNDLGLEAGQVDDMPEQGGNIPLILNDQCKWLIHTFESLRQDQ